MYMNKVMLMGYLAHDAEGRTSRDGRPYTPVRVSDCRPHRLRDTVAVRKSPAGFQLEDVSRLLEHSSVRVSHVCGAALIAANRFLRVRPEDQGSLHRTDALAARRKAAPGRRVGVRFKLDGFQLQSLRSGTRVVFSRPAEPRESDEAAR